MPAIQELMKSLVMSESQDERMDLAEKLTDAIGGENPSTEEMDNLKTEIERLNGEVSTGKQKFIDRFFQGDNTKKEKEDNPQDKKSDDEKRAESVTTNDLVKEMGK